MSTSVPVSPNYDFSTSDLCLPIFIDLEQDSFSVNSSWIAGAFILGLFLGAIIPAICAPFCLRDLEKKKRQDDEEAMLQQMDADNANRDNDIDPSILVATHIDGKKKKGKQKGKRKGRYINDDDDDTEEEEGKGQGGRVFVQKDVKLDPSLINGLSDVMLKFTSEGADEEMTKQDIQKVDKMTMDLQKEKDDVFLKMLKLRMKKMNVGEPALSYILKNVIDDLQSKRKQYQDEKQDEEQALRTQHAKDKDTQMLDNQLENLEAQTNTKLARLHDEERNVVKKELMKNTELSEKEVESLMDKLFGDMSSLEKKHALELARQRRALEERLARRKQVIDLRKLQDQQESDQVKESLDSYEDVMKKMVEDGKLTEKQKNQLLNEYMLDMQKLAKTRDREAQRQQEELAAKLAQRRKKRLEEVQLKQMREKAVFMERAEKSVNTQDFVEDFHELNEQQRLEMEHVAQELDQNELSTLDQVRQNNTGGKKKVLDNRSKEMEQAITSAVGAGSATDVDRLLRLHKQRMAQYEDERKEERNSMGVKLRERLEQRMNKLDEDEEQIQQDQDTLAEQQISTVNKVLSSNIELSDEVKKKILREHEHNMQVLNNQLQKSKLKQQKSLDNKLNQRRAKMAQLRQQKEEMMMNKVKASREEREKLQQQLDAELQLEEQKLQEEKKKAVLALRQRLAAETEEALRQQEQELGLLIGRLEVGAARRQAIIQKQDETLQNLQEKLEDRLAREGSSLAGVDQIIQQHSNQMEHLNQQLQETREHQENLIKEKIQAKKFEKEQDLQEQIAVEKQINRSNSVRRKGASKATDVLSHLFMEQKHKKQQDELEQEMKVEMERNREQLNQQLEQDLHTELEGHKRELLNQLALASNMSRNEIENAVDSAVKDTGKNKKAAKKLAKELRAGVERTKTDMSMDYGMEYEDDELYDRRNSGVIRPASGLAPIRRPMSASVIDVPKKKGKKKKGKSSVAPEPREEWEEDDDELL